jgi:hypothetical protein
MLALSLSGPQLASATFHEMMIREVYPGSLAHPDSEYVELQMWSAGQNLVGGHQLGLYDTTGAQVGTATFAHDVSGDANQSTLVLATPEAEAEFGIAADAAMPPGLLNPAGGAACWESLDCVAWGSFSGLAKSPAGPAAAAGGVPDGMALRRTIEPGCPTLLEPGDDHDNSAADFSPVFPAPRPNSVPPSERSCSSPTVGGGASPGVGSTGAAAKRPQTRLRRRPGHRTRDRTPTFGFGSSVPGSTYLCKLDGAGFKACRTPFTARRLAIGPHVFEVEARTPSGIADHSPAIVRFRVVRRQSP